MARRVVDQKQLKSFAEAGYLMSLLVSLGFGVVANKPELAIAAGAMGTWSGSRMICQQVGEKPLQGKIRGLQTELAEALLKVEKLTQALRQNWQWHEKYKALESASQAQLEESNQRISLLQSEFAIVTRRVEELKQELDKELQNNAEWQLAYEKLKTKLETVKQPYDLEVGRLRDEAKEYRKKYEQAFNDYNAAVDRNSELVAEVNYLKIQIQALLAPRKLAEGLDTNNLANQLVDWFKKSNPSIIVDAESADISGSDWVLMFRVREKKDIPRIRELATAIKIDFSLPQNPSISVTGDFLKITIHRAEVHNESKYLKIDPQWMKDAFVFLKDGKLEPHHVRISGSTECGKSTLASNAIGVLIASIPFIQIELADPLIKGKSEWKTLTPKYKGHDETVAGFIQFYNDYKACDEGKAERGHPRLFLMDEFDKVMKSHPELIPLALEIWKTGRQYSFYLWIIGQSAMVGKFGLNLEDIDNLVGVYIGKAIERGFSDSAEDPNYTARLREEWHLARARGVEYLCLVRPHTTNRRPFLAKMPLPGTFATGGEAFKIAENREAEEQINYRSLEFDIDETRANLESLLETNPTDVEPTADLGLTQKELNQVKTLIDKGLKTSEIIKKIWNLSPGPGSYSNRKKQVEKIRKSMGK